jgi:hypothetical protein
MAYNAVIFIFSANVKAHAPLPAAASVDHGVGVVVTESHGNRAAGSGCHDATCSALPILDRLGTGVSGLGAIGDRMTIEKAPRGYNVRKYIAGNLDEIYLGVSKANLKELVEVSAP